MEEYIKEAEAILNQFPDTPARESLLQLMHYAVKRNK